MLKVTKSSTNFYLTSYRYAKFSIKYQSADVGAAEPMFGQKSSAIYREVKHNFNAGPGTLPKPVLS